MTRQGPAAPRGTVAGNPRRRAVLCAGTAPPPRRPSIKDVANRAGVSWKTVSNVLHDRPHVRAENRVAVQAAIAELGYRTSLAGRQLRQGRTSIAALALLDRLGLAGRADHHPAQLSGGEQQRLAVACGVAGDPALVVADEPTAELDTAAAERVLAAMEDLAAAGVAFVLSSHDPRVMAIADGFVRLDHGRLVSA